MTEEACFLWCNEKDCGCVGEKPPTEAEYRRRVPSFDPSCLFLLNWEHTNLFEQAGNTKTIYRCKGCRQIIQTSQRKEHHRYHVVEQEEAARLARLENIAKAREARKERKAEAA